MQMYFSFCVINAHLAILENNEPISVLKRDDPVTCNCGINLGWFCYTVHRIQAIDVYFLNANAAVIHAAWVAGGTWPSGNDSGVCRRKEETTATVHLCISGWLG